MENTPTPTPQNQNTAPENTVPAVSAFKDDEAFKLMQRKAHALCKSTLVPKDFQGEANLPNCMIALEMSHRMGASVLMVMQNLYIVHGKPSWSSSFIISALNSCRRFSPLRFEMKGEGATRTCTAWAYDLSTGDKLEGVEVSISMAEAEGWVNKSGSKWKTMPELMLRYRSATFFGRLYAPDVLMGMFSREEIEDTNASAVAVTDAKREAYEAKLKLLNGEADGNV